LHDLFKIGIRSDKRNQGIDDDDDDDDGHGLYVVCAALTCRHMSFFRKHEERKLVLSAYNAILNFIPKLKRILPLEDDADPEYFYKVVEAVRSLHTPCRTMT
jgi:hypothetical protein